MRPDVKFALIAGSLAVIAGAGAWAWSATRAKKPEIIRRGSLLCPRHVGRRPAPAGAGRGDFVVLQLQSPDGEFHESTWATVAEDAGDTLVVVLTGEQVAEGVRPLQTDRHGFRLGHRMIVGLDCIWEVFQPGEFTGQILCGPQVAELGEFLGQDLFVVAAGLTVQAGDRVQILVASREASGTAWSEKLWTRIATISPSGQVITAIVEDDPELTEHSLGQGSVVRYNRDCVVGV